MDINNVENKVENVEQQINVAEQPVVQPTKTEVSEVQSTINRINETLNSIKDAPATDSNWDKYCDLLDELDVTLDKISTSTYNQDEERQLVDILKGDTKTFIATAKQYEIHREEYLRGSYRLDVELPYQEALKQQAPAKQDFGAWLESAPAIEKTVQEAPVQEAPEVENVKKLVLTNPDSNQHIAA